MEPDLREHVVSDRGIMFLVADGLGGAVSGEIASGMAVTVVRDTLRARWGAAATSDATAFAAALKEATEAANAAIHAFATQHPEHKGMGTTATVAGLLGDTLYVVQVGDSRGYLIRDGVAEQITKDQSLMQRLIEAGELTPEEAEQSERRNIILQALGPEAVVKIDLTHQSVRRGDTLVLCTDGLSGLVRRDEIAAIVTQEEDLEAACDRLIERANDRGGPDNITVVIARFEGNGLQSVTSEDSVGHTIFALAGSTPPGVPAERRGSGAPDGRSVGQRPDVGSMSWALRGNMPYVLAFIAAVLVALFFVITRLRVDPAPPPPPAATDSVGAVPLPASMVDDA